MTFDLDALKQAAKSIDALPEEAILAVDNDYLEAASYLLNFGCGCCGGDGDRVGIRKAALLIAAAVEQAKLAIARGGL